MKQKILSIFVGGLLVSNVYAVYSVLNYDYGLQAGSEFELKQGSCDGCIDKAASFYFKDEVVAIPKKKSEKVPSFIWNNSTVVSEGF